MHLSISNRSGSNSTFSELGDHKEADQVTEAMIGVPRLMLDGIKRMPEPVRRLLTILGLSVERYEHAKLSQAVDAVA
jgi:hypothetical protein